MIVHFILLLVKCGGRPKRIQIKGRIKEKVSDHPLKLQGRGCRQQQVREQALTTNEQKLMKEDDVIGSDNE